MDFYLKNGNCFDFRLSELRQQKAKLSRQVRDKEEELEGTLQKMDALRNDLRRAEKLRRDLEARAEELQADVVREKRLRERAEEHARSLHEDMERLQQKAQAGEAAMNSMELNQELLRLRSELEKQEMQHKELASQLSSRHSAELSALNEQLLEADNMRATYEKESALLKEKVEQSRQESAVENEEVIVEVRRAHEREKQLLLEDTKRVVAELERFSDSCLRLQSEKRAMEEELSELRSKQAAVAQWEAQISEIIQWVSDEKDARGYLQALTSKMTEEMENLKTQGVGGTPSNVRQTIRPKHSLPPLVELNFLIDSNCFVICRKRTGRTGDLRN
jgi:serine/threonine-protein kinase MRCK